MRVRQIGFNPRLPGGRRPSLLGEFIYRHWFQSTPSGGKATSAATRCILACTVSIHAFRGEGDLPQLHADQRAVAVSIHAFRGEGDLEPETELLHIWVSIHAFRGEGDLVQHRFRFAWKCFNPRLPGGRRPADLALLRAAMTVSIHAFRGEGDDAVLCGDRSISVSIHAFRGEGDVQHPPRAISA